MLNRSGLGSDRLDRTAVSESWGRASEWMSALQVSLRRWVGVPSIMLCSPMKPDVPLSLTMNWHGLSNQRLLPSPCQYWCARSSSVTGDASSKHMTKADDWMVSKEAAFNSSAFINRSRTYSSRNLN